MKKFAVILIVVAAALAEAQTQRLIDDFVDRPSRACIAGPFIHPVENVVNEWQGPMSDQVIASIVSQIIWEEWGLEIGSDTATMMDEAAQRDQLRSSPYVNQESPRLKFGTMDPPLVAVKTITWGYASSHRGGIDIGRGSADIEQGKTSGGIRVLFKDLVSQKVFASISHEVSYSSINVERVTFDPAWWQRNRLPYINWQMMDTTDPKVRRSLVFVQKCYEGLRKKLREAKPKIFG